MKKQTKVKFSNSEHSSWYYLWDKSMCQLVQINPIFWKQIIPKALSQLIGQKVNLCFLWVGLKIFIGRNNCESFSMFLYVVIEKMQLLGEVRRIRQKLHIFKILTMKFWNKFQVSTQKSFGQRRYFDFNFQRT